MRLSQFPLAMFAVCILSSTAARADSFAFSFGNPTDIGVPGELFSSSGTVTGTMISPGEFLITDVSGSITRNGFNTQPILGVIPVGRFSQNENLLFVSGGVGSFSDFAYYSQNYAIEIFTSGGTSYELTEYAATRTQDLPVTVTSIGTTPEPGSLVLLGSGLLGMLGVMRRRIRI